MAAIICVGVMLSVWMVILFVHFTANPNVPGGMYTSFRTGGTYSAGTAHARAEAPQATSVHYAPEMPAPLEPPAQPATIANTHHIAPVWTVSLSTDSTEHELLAALRIRPDDAASRMVFSDWLEQRGEVLKAAYVRGDHLELLELATIANTTSATWRAVTCRQHVACVLMKCPKRWDRLDTFGDDERTRRCPACGRTARYCLTLDDVRWVRMSGDLAVVDLAGQPLPLPVDDRFDTSAAS